MKSPQIPCQPIEYGRLDFLAAGGSSIVYGIDETRILKEYYDDDECIATERKAFDRLGSHPNIVKCLENQGKKSIVLERGVVLRTANRDLGTNDYTLNKKLSWIRDAAEGLRYVHEKGIIHADVGCSNMILIGDTVKIIDFEGCSIDGSEALAAYHWYNRREVAPPSVVTDIFAFGCAVYELMTGNYPNHDLEPCEDRRRLVQQLYTQDNFPSVDKLLLRDLIIGCWRGSFQSMDQVVRSLDTCRS